VIQEQQERDGGDLAVRERILADRRKEMYCDWCEKERPEEECVEAYPNDPEDGRMICNSCAEEQSEYWISADEDPPGLPEEELNEDPEETTWRYMEGVGWVNEIGERW
jgi:hypothetical protein